MDSPQNTTADYLTRGPKNPPPPQNIELKNNRAVELFDDEGVPIKASPAGATTLYSKAKAYLPHIQKSLETLHLSPPPGPIEGYPKFEDSKISTRTFIINTNLSLEEKFYLELPITRYIIVPKKRGRRKKVDAPDPNADIRDGSIITVRSDDGAVRGVDLKKPRKPFRNSTTIVMIVEGKMINFKVSQNGKFQMTGCKTWEQAEKCIKFFWKHVRDREVYTLSGKYFEAYFRPVMCNLGFPLGFMINRERLDSYFNLNYPQYPSMWESSQGSAGANIKFPIHDIENTKIKRLRFREGKWMSSFTTYGEHKKLFPGNKKNEEEKYTTFLVFHKGKVNMSSTDSSMMAAPYYRFLQIIDECRGAVEEEIEAEDWGAEY